MQSPVISSNQLVSVYACGSPLFSYCCSPLPVPQSHSVIVSSYRAHQVLLWYVHDISWQKSMRSMLYAIQDPN